MKNAVILTLAALLGTAPADAAKTKPVDPGFEPPKIEVMFVLDTTGSMGGLITGAKAKIWSIVRELQEGAPRPDVKVGLIAYRDRGDAYVTQVTPLTGDLDAMYETLSAYQAGGGGDGPEDVLSGLRDAVQNAGWSKNADALRVVYLVGDAPPHSDYQDVPTYQATLKAAREKGILVNAIRCGGDARTGEVWSHIAQLGGGFYFSISQSGGVHTVSTPFDAEIGELQHKLEGTYLSYGARREAFEEKKGRMEKVLAAAPAAAMADRAAVMESRGYAAEPEADLVGSVGAGRADLDALKNEELPERLRGKSKAEQKKILKGLADERAALSRKMRDLRKRRDAHLAAERAKAPKDSFDAKVLESIRKQAATKGITY